jgi:hypothetical protein
MPSPRSLPVSLGTFLCAGVLALPVHDLPSWQQEAFSKKSSNVFSVEKGALLVTVKKSASPLFFKLSEAKKITGFKATGEFKGLPVFKNLSLQGKKGNDDYPLRLGFVVPGKKTLSGLYKFIAAQWVKRIYNLIPEGTGLDRIEFFNVSQNAAELGVKRTHYSSDLLKETIVAVQKKSGPFSVEHTFASPIDTLAIWLSIDGDDTLSDYEVSLSAIELHY